MSLELKIVLINVYLPDMKTNLFQPFSLTLYEPVKAGGENILSIL